MMRLPIFQFLLLGIALITFAISTPTHAQEKPVYVQASLITETQQAVPGQILWVGIHQIIQDHWHTYWRNPGDSGLETTVEWIDLPAGVTAGDIHWPIPQALPFETLVNYGYENDVLLAIPIDIDPGFSGNQITLTARSTWLVCSDVCIPEAETLSITVPVQNTTTKSENADLFTKARAQWPQITNETKTQFHYSTNNNLFKLTASGLETNVRTAHFFPYEWGIIPFNAEQITHINDNQITLQTSLDGSNINDLVEGVLVIETSNQTRTGYEVQATISPETVTTTDLQPEAVKPKKLFDLPRLLLFALIGGMILNLMPCVFPVLSMKALSLVNYADKQPGQVRLSGVFYTIGVVISFSAFAAIILLLRATGEQVGWGFQLQSPLFISTMSLFLYLIGLNLAGFYDIGSSLMGIGNKLTSGDSHKSSFWTGVLATIVATPCTAPFMASALGATLVLPYHESFLIFVTLGLGMALPYLLLTLIPGLFKFLPKPGQWMETFKQFLAFPMIGFAIWLVWVLLQQSGPDAVLIILVIALATTFVIWLEKRAQNSFFTKILVPVVIILSLYGIFHIDTYTTTKYQLGSNVSETKDSFYIPYSETKLTELRQNNKPVFVNMTAAWCITCLANEKVALSTETVRATFKAKGITVMKGDWTSFDDSITRYLQQYDRTGVPLYVYYDENGQETVLPQILTPSTVLEALKN
jgi:thiol:disulfide interchange protein